MREHEINKLNNFIAGWYFEDPSICDKIINYFNLDSTHKYSGKVVEPLDKIAKAKSKYFKNSIDALLSDDHLCYEYSIQLNKVLEKYKEKYPCCNNVPLWGVEILPQIQYYVPKEGGFHEWHHERTSNDLSVIHRHLVYMTYLNDVTDGGETAWYHQNLKIKPEKGLTVIWPVDWTFTHKGCVSDTQEKYIVTGWYNIKQKN